MPDYSKAKIYKLVCNITGEVYYGSTCVGLAQRLQKHKECFKYNGRCSSKQIIERGNYSIVLCEDCPCENREQLKSFERKWIEENECINIQLPGRTRKEYAEQFSEHLRQRKKENYEKNKTEILQVNKEWREIHRDEKLKYDRDYYHKTKQLVKCPHCGKEMLNHSLKRHLKTQH